MTSTEVTTLLHQDSIWQGIGDSGIKALPLQRLLSGQGWVCPERLWKGEECWRALLYHMPRGNPLRPGFYISTSWDSVHSQCHRTSLLFSCACFNPNEINKETDLPTEGKKAVPSKLNWLATVHLIENFLMSLKIIWLLFNDNSSGSQYCLVPRSSRTSLLTDLPQGFKILGFRVTDLLKDFSFESPKRLVQQKVFTYLSAWFQVIQ